MDGAPTKNIPTILVIFGATGDLMAKKIVPALFHLFEKGMLPKMFHVIGFGRRAMASEQFQEYVAGLLRQHKTLKIKEETRAAFLKRFSYHQGMFDAPEDYRRLATSLGPIASAGCESASDANAANG